MSSEIEHIEYDHDVNPYPSSGKKYNGEKAIISMTSWKMRIATCSKTIFSLLKQCPGFHIVLVLSEEEFPQKEKELPENLMVFVENELIELLWVYKNYKSFKKVLFTMDKYRDVPVISADDDCIYTCNYAQKLYDKWKKNKTRVISLHGWSSGYGIIFRPLLSNNIKFNKITQRIINTCNDDTFYYFLFKNIYIENKIEPNKIVIFNEASKICPISTIKRKQEYKNKKYISNLLEVFNNEYNK